MLNKCGRCHAVFNQLGSGELCPQCDDEVMRYARKVDDYLLHYPGRGSAAIVVATDVPREFVERYVNGQTPEEAAHAVFADLPPCTRCGETAAVVGPLCRSCAIALRQEVRDEVQAAKDEDAAAAPSAAVRGVVASRRARDGAGFYGARYKSD